MALKLDCETRHQISPSAGTPYTQHNSLVLIGSFVSLRPGRSGCFGVGCLVTSTTHVGGLKEEMPSMAKHVKANLVLVDIFDRRHMAGPTLPYVRIADWAIKCSTLIRVFSPETQRGIYRDIVGKGSLSGPQKYLPG